MAKAKLSLAVAPTFKATVQIPVPGGRSAAVEFVFKARTRDEFKEFLEILKDAEDVEMILDVASGWDLDEPFDKANINKLVQSYMGAARAILDVYISELTGARAKN
jgi:hypothetical protein